MNSGPVTVDLLRLPIGYLVTVYERGSVDYSFTIDFDHDDRAAPPMEKLNLDDRTQDAIKKCFARAKQDYEKRKKQKKEKK